MTTESLPPEVEHLSPLDEVKTDAEKLEAKIRRDLIPKITHNITPSLIGGLLQELCGSGRMLPPPPKWKVPNAPYWWRTVFIPKVMERITPDYIRETEPWMKLLRGEDSYYNQVRWTAVTIATFAIFETFPQIMKEACRDEQKKGKQPVAPSAS